MLTRRFGAAAAVGLGILICVACAQTQAAQQAHTDAKTKGKFKVRLTTNAESVVGACKYVTLIQADQDPVGPVSEANLADYFRTEAVYKGADTVVVRGRVGEAYICGPGPLKPDGTPQNTYDSPPQQP